MRGKILINFLKMKGAKMSTNTIKESYDEGLATFYLEKVCPEADQIFRFAFALTLDRNSAAEYVQSTYKKSTDELASLVNLSVTELQVKLLQSCYEIHKSSHTEHPPESSGLGSFFVNLDEQVRAVLVLLDVIGLNVQETSDVMEMEEIDVRKNVAVSRKALIEFSP